MNEAPGRLMLCTDLDRTLLPNGIQNESEQARPLFCRLAALPQVILVYVTGRHRELVEQAIAEYQLPQPDYVISDVGTSIYQVSNSDWQLLSDWSNHIARDWAGYTREDISRLPGNIEGLELQEPEKQNTWKLSYYLPVDNKIDEISDLIRERLNNKGINASIIWSIDETKKIGLLDILPLRASKHYAIEFLLAYPGCTLNEVVFAGDSGNDISVMSSEIPSVLVANATDDVRSEALAQARRNGQSERLYLATGNYLGMNGNYSAGILEGIAHYRPDFDQWLQNTVKDG